MKTSAMISEMMRNGAVTLRAWLFYDKKNDDAGAAVFSANAIHVAFGALPRLIAR